MPCEKVIYLLDIEAFTFFLKSLFFFKKSTNLIRGANTLVYVYDKLWSSS